MRLRVRVLGAALSAACGGDQGSATDGGGTTIAGETTSSTGDVDTSTGVGPTSTSASPTSTTTSETGVLDSSGATFSVEYCGNGIVDPGEECDDDNELDGDACSARCTNVFEIEWTISHDGPASDYDAASAVVTDDADNIYVLGRATEVSGDVWLQQYAPDGSAGWSFGWDGPDSLSDRGIDLAWVGSDLAIVGASGSALSATDMLIMLVDPRTQSVVWSQTLDGPGSGPETFDDYDVGIAVATDPDGNIVVGGHIAVDGEMRNVRLAEYDADGGLRWERTWDDGEGHDDCAVSIRVIPDGTVYALVLAEIDVLPQSVVLVFDGEGMPLPEETHESTEFVAFDFELLGNGDALLVGADANGNAVLRTDAEWSPQWLAQAPAGSRNAVAHDGSEQAFAAGNVATLQAPDAWVGAYRADGSPWWGDIYDNPDAHEQDDWAAVAVDSQGDVIVVGSETTLDEDVNAIVRKYHPL
jgi:cysteine-rich repeat protein